jgi:hypothetical protein
MHKHRVRSAAATHHRWSAAAIEIKPGTYQYPKGSTARTIAGSAMDLELAARLRRAGHKAAARDALHFARDARLFAPAARLPG